MIEAKPKRIGIDLDNTLIDYSKAAQHVALRENIPLVESVQDLRKLFRDSENEKWQYLQSRLYTEGLKYAEPAHGSLEFLSGAHRLGAQIYVVSHKTQVTPAKFGSLDLRKPALDWLERKRIVPNFFPHNRVFFCSSQEEKVERVRHLSLDWFIDDLQEVLDSPGFPGRTTGWLYSHQPTEPISGQIQYRENSSSPLVFSSFVELAKVLREAADGA